MGETETLMVEALKTGFVNIVGCSCNLNTSYIYDTFVDLDAGRIMDIGLLKDIIDNGQLTNNFLYIVHY